MTEQQFSELLALLRQLAADVAAIKAQGESIATSTHALKAVVMRSISDGVAVNCDLAN